MEETDAPMMDEDVERSWREYLQEFRKEVYPMFADYGIGIDAALVVWWLNRMMNRMPLPDDYE